MTNLTIAEHPKRESRPSAATRLLNTIVDPLHAFDSLNEHAPWTLAFAATVLVRFGSLFVFYRPAVTLPKIVGSVAFQILTVGPLFVFGAIAIWLSGQMCRCRLRWAAALSVAAHACFAFTLLTVVAASVAGALLPEAVDVDVRHPPFTNFGRVAGVSTGPIVTALLTAVDFRWVYAGFIVWLGARGAVRNDARGRAGWLVAILGAGRLIAAVAVAGLSR